MSAIEKKSTRVDYTANKTLVSVRLVRNDFPDFWDFYRQTRLYVTHVKVVKLHSSIVICPTRFTKKTLQRRIIDLEHSSL